MAAVGGTGSYDGPAWVEVFDNKMDGSSFHELFPWELTNSDYFRRVVAQVGYSLQPLVENTLMTPNANGVNANGVGSGRGVVVVGAQGKELKAVIDAVRKAYEVDGIVVVAAQDINLYNQLTNGTDYAADLTKKFVVVVQGNNLRAAVQTAVAGNAQDFAAGKIVFLVEAAYEDKKSGGGAGAPAPPAPPAAKVVVGAQGRELKSLEQAAGAKGKFVFHSQHPEGLIGCAVGLGGTWRSAGRVDARGTLALYFWDPVTEPDTGNTALNVTS